jgi:lipoprotein-anchoring transpeptidase ErfK/SrfK
MGIFLAISRSLSIASVAVVLAAVVSPVWAQIPAAPNSAADAESPLTGKIPVRTPPPGLPPIEPLLPEVTPPEGSPPAAADEVTEPNPMAVPVRLVLSLTERRVYVYEGETVKASFPVAVGREGWETPTGNFKVTAMLEQPGWTNPFTGEVVPPGPENPLGERWIGFWTDGDNVIGFHGTPDRDSVGTAASHGCVRMFNEDIQQLYEMVTLGTPVQVES